MEGARAILFRAIDAILNFFAWIHAFASNCYESARAKAFEHKLFYYAIYDLKTKRFVLMHDYQGLFSVFWFYLVNHVCKISYAGVTPLDLDTILHADNLVIVASYVANGDVRHAIFDLDAYERTHLPATQKIVFAYTNTRDDLTHEFERFKDTVFDVATRIGAQNVYNILCGYSRRDPEAIEWISTMTDIDFEERRITI